MARNSHKRGNRPASPAPVERRPGEGGSYFRPKDGGALERVEFTRQVGDADHGAASFALPSADVVIEPTQET